MSGDHDDSPLSQAEHEAVEWLSRLREGGRRYQSEFEEWYSADQTHADAYDRVLATYEEARRPARSARSRQYWGMAIASIAAVLALFAYLGVPQAPSSPTAGTAYAADTKIGEIRTVALDDGTKVTLDTESAIRADFDTTRRQVHLLRGRAHFEVAAEPRPFVISTEAGSVSTSGSVLDVAYFDGKTQVGLLSGGADLRPFGQTAAILHVSPGTVVAVGRDGPVGSLMRITANDMRWTAGMLSFEDKPVSLVVTTANRYSDAQIVLADPALGALRFTGTVRAKDTLGLARMIAAMFGLRLDTANPLRLVLSR